MIWVGVIRFFRDVDPLYTVIDKNMLCFAGKGDECADAAESNPEQVKYGDAPQQGIVSLAIEQTSVKPCCTGGRPDVDEVAAALARIAGYISQEKKFPTACKLLIQLLSREDVLEKRHGPLLFDALKAAMLDPHRAVTPLVAREYSKLFSLGSTRSELFTSDQLAQLDVYELWAVVRNQLKTDDSFAFNRTIRHIKKLITELPESVDGSEQQKQEEKALKSLACEKDAFSNRYAQQPCWNMVEAVAMRRTALLDCVVTSCQFYSIAWAKTSIDLLVEHSRTNSARFLPSQRSQIDDVANLLRDQKAGSNKVVRVFIRGFKRFFSRGIVAMSLVLQIILIGLIIILIMALFLSTQGTSIKEASRDTTSFERATAAWSTATNVSHRGKVGAGGDGKSSAWLG